MLQTTKSCTITAWIWVSKSPHNLQQQITYLFNNFTSYLPKSSYLQLFHILISSAVLQSQQSTSLC